MSKPDPSAKPESEPKPAPDPDSEAEGSLAGSELGALVGSAVTAGVWHSFQPCLATIRSDTQDTAAPLETACLNGPVEPVYSVPPTVRIS